MWGPPGPGVEPASPALGAQSLPLDLQASPLHPPWDRHRSSLASAASVPQPDPLCLTFVEDALFQLGISHAAVPVAWLPGCLPDLVVSCLSPSLFCLHCHTCQSALCLAAPAVTQQSGPQALGTSALLPIFSSHVGHSQGWLMLPDTHSLNLG